jgi:tRNA(Ile)-lysidine synthase
LCLNNLAKDLDAKYILTAHHLGDQVETIILNLARGVGPLEIWGMRELSGKVLRPFLSVSKEDILDYAKKNKLRYVIDKSNFDLKYNRNRIRKNIVPELKKINRSLEKTIKSSIFLGEELSLFVENSVLKLEKRARKQNRLKLAVLKIADPYIAKALIMKMLHEMLGEKKDIYSKNINEIYGLLNAPGNKTTELKGLVIEKEYQYILFNKKSKTKIPSPTKTTLKIGRKTSFGEFGFRAFFGTAEIRKNNILLPAEFSDSLSIRTRRPGDRIKTASGTKKIQDLFVDAKITKSRRDAWPIVVHKKEIVWVPLLAAKKFPKENNNLIVEVR